MDRQALEVVAEFPTGQRRKLQHRCSRTVLCAFVGVSLQMLDDDRPCELVLVFEARQVGDAKVPQIAKEDNVKVAASLLEVAEESFHKVHGMQQLEAI